MYLIAVKPLGSCCCRLFPIASPYKGHFESTFASFLLGCRFDRFNTAAISGIFWSGINLKGRPDLHQCPEKIKFKEIFKYYATEGIGK